MVFSGCPWSGAGAETFGWNRSRGNVSAPAPDQNREFHALTFHYQPQEPNIYGIYKKKATEL